MARRELTEDVYSDVGISVKRIKALIDYYTVTRGEGLNNAHSSYANVVKAADLLRENVVGLCSILEKAGLTS